MSGTWFIRIDYSARTVSVRQGPKAGWNPIGTEADARREVCYWMAYGYRKVP